MFFSNSFRSQHQQGAMPAPVSMMQQQQQIMMQQQQGGGPPVGMMMNQQQQQQMMMQQQQSQQQAQRSPQHMGGIPHPGASPLGPHSSSSPMHSTPHSPLMSPSPSSGVGMSPMVPSPHTPVASPSLMGPLHSPSGGDGSGYSPCPPMPSPSASYGPTSPYPQHSHYPPSRSPFAPSGGIPLMRQQQPGQMVRRTSMPSPSASPLPPPAMGGCSGVMAVNNKLPHTSMGSSNNVNFQHRLPTSTPDPCHTSSSSPVGTSPALEYCSNPATPAQQQPPVNTNSVGMPSSFDATNNSNSLMPASSSPATPTGLGGGNPLCAPFKFGLKGGSARFCWSRWGYPIIRLKGGQETSTTTMTTSTTNSSDSLDSNATSSSSSLLSAQELPSTVTTGMPQTSTIDCNSFVPTSVVMSSSSGLNFNNSSNDNNGASLSDSSALAIISTLPTSPVVPTVSSPSVSTLLSQQQPSTSVFPHSSSNFNTVFSSMAGGMSSQSVTVVGGSFNTISTPSTLISSIHNERQHILNSSTLSSAAPSTISTSGLSSQTQMVMTGSMLGSHPQQSVGLQVRQVQASGGYNPTIGSSAAGNIVAISNSGNLVSIPNPGGPTNPTSLAVLPSATRPQLTGVPMGMRPLPQQQQNIHQGGPLSTIAPQSVVGRTIHGLIPGHTNQQLMASRPAAYSQQEGISNAIVSGSNVGMVGQRTPMTIGSLDHSVGGPVVSHISQILDSSIGQSQEAMATGPSSIAGSVNNSVVSNVGNLGCSGPASAGVMVSQQAVLPQPPKSSIPPSSRHQAVIGIPGGGAIPSQIPTYTSHITHPLESQTTVAAASTLTTAALAPRPLPAVPPPQHGPRPHHLIPSHTGVRMLVKGSSGGPVHMMMIRHSSAAAMQQQATQQIVSQPGMQANSPVSPMPPPVSSRSPHHPQSPSPLNNNNGSRVSPAQSPVGGPAGSPSMVPASPSASPHPQSTTPNSSTPTNSTISSQKEDVSSVGTTSGGSGQNALLKQLLQNNNTASLHHHSQHPHHQQQFVVLRGSLNHTASQVPQPPTPIILPSSSTQQIHHQRPALVSQQQIHHPVQGSSQQVLISSNQLHHHSTQQRLVNHQQQRAAVVGGGNAPGVVASTPLSSHQVVVAGSGGAPPHPFSAASSIVSQQHPALRQLPPSPTPHLDELVEENNAKKRAAAASQGVQLATAGGSGSSAVVAAAGQQHPRRRSQSKDGPNKVTPRRNRQEEDYETFLESMMTQLRAMPPLTVMEPTVFPNFNVCAMYGAGELPKLGRPGHDHRTGKLVGKSGSQVVKDNQDYYETKPLGRSLPVMPPLKAPPTARGFYSSEFPPPKIGFPLDDQNEEVAAITANATPTIIPAPVVGNAIVPVTRPSSTSSSTAVADSPDTVLTSSSPECVMPESPQFRGLRLIDMEEEIPDRCSSPPIPLLAPIPRKKELPKFSIGTGVQSKQFPNKKIIGLESIKQETKPKDEIKQEHSATFESTDIKKETLVVKEEEKENHDESYASIILKDRMGENPALPLKHEGNVTVEMTLPSNASGDIVEVLRSLANVLNIAPPKTYDIKVDGAPPKVQRKWKLPDRQEEVHAESILNGRTRFCRQCNEVADKNPITKQVRELPYIDRSQVTGLDEITFCSKRCFIQFTLAHRVNLPTVPPLKQEKEEVSDTEVDSDDCDSERGGVKRKMEDSEEEFPVQPDGKRFRGHKYRIFNGETFLPEKKDKPTDKEMTELLFRMQITYRKRGLPQDSRRCTLCQVRIFLF